MKIWFKLWTDTRLTASETIEITDDDTRTHKVFRALEEACLAFDLGKPIWLDANVNEFKRRSKTRRILQPSEREVFERDCKTIL